jgi:DNA polymerase-3 subunit alpha
MDNFVQLHIHSQMSTLDGLASAKEIALRAKELGQKAVAITNHGAMVDWYEFYLACKEQDIKPIIGNEIYFTDDMNAKEKGTKHYHLVLLAMNDTGLKNLFKITTIGYQEGFYGKPRVDWKVLREHNEGLICLSACLASYPAKLIAEDNYPKAKKVIMKFKKIFGDRFYLEVQPNLHKLQKKVNQAYVNWHVDMGIQLVATTDAHYLRPEDYEKHKLFTKIGGFDSDVYKDNYWCSGNEVINKLVEQTDMCLGLAQTAVWNTYELAKRIENYNIDTSTKLPHFPIPEEFLNSATVLMEKLNTTAEDEYLKQLCRNGWVKRGIPYLSEEEQHIYLERLKVEFDVIFTKGFSGYFLIVQDFVNWARSQGIVVGYGRGSAGGSLVAWLTGIVELDPIKHNLLFERFLNPERSELPDIDIDFADRDRVYRYLQDKYGADRVASVLTFGTMGARGCIRDVGRALGMPLSEVDKIAKLIPERPSIKLQEAIDEVEELQEYASIYSNLFLNAFALEGKVRHFSTHASALVIGDRPLVELTALMVDKRGNPQIQCDMGTAEKLGILKFDLLGLKTLGVIQKAVDLINGDVTL